MAGILNDITGALGAVYKSIPSLPALKEVETVVVKEVQMIGTPPAARVFVRIAGLSGALAVGLGAYGSHVFRNKEIDPHLKERFEIANKYHYLHTLALFAVPLVRRPVLTGTLMTAGLVLFSGSCYYQAMVVSTPVRAVTPFGGVLLILAWLSMALPRRIPARPRE